MLKKSVADTLKTSSKTVTQKITEGTSVWIGNNVAHKVTAAASQSALGTVSSKTEDINLMFLL